MPLNLSGLPVVSLFLPQSLYCHLLVNRVLLFVALVFIFPLAEATSAMDSKSEQIVQQTLDTIMSNPQQTCIVIAHRLSTIRNADRIAVIDKGTVREIGTHEELMGNPNGRYRRLQAMQNLHSEEEENDSKSTGLAMEDRASELIELSKPVEKRADDDGDDGETEVEVDEQRASENAKRARLLASSDKFYFLVGGIGAIFFGLVFPSWGFVFAYMIEILYTAVEDDCPAVPDGVFGDCDAYWKYIADDMQDQSLRIFYAFLGVIAATLLGSTLLFWGFGVASERMNKRVRDSAFTSLLRQEIAWFDVRSPGTITSHLAEDAALLHAFCGEPIRTLALNLSSVLIGVIVSFVYMW
jgi:ATP-binding cassette subfamily B (MDR/TAP) protein 1